MATHWLIRPGLPAPPCREGDETWLLLDPFAPSSPSPEANGDPQTPRPVVDLDGALLHWNARAKHRLRAAGWEVQGGMTYLTLELLRDWMRTMTKRHQARAFHLTLPDAARFPDLSSPNACLLSESVLPELRAAGQDLILSPGGDPSSWESVAGFQEGQITRTAQALATALQPGTLWRSSPEGRLVALHNGF